MQHRFKSLLNPDKYGFAYDTDGDWEKYYRFPQPLHWQAWMFETLGDSFTQHGPMTPVGAELFADYCLSLAKFILEMPEDPEQAIHRFGIDHIHPDLSDFAFQVRRTEKEIEAGTRKWFNAADRKMSANPAKQHDKRWQEITSCEDGSMTGAYGIIAQVYPRADLLKRYTILQNLSEAANRLSRNVDNYAAREKFLPACLHPETPSEHYAAWLALDQAFTAVENRRHALRSIECVVGNITRSKAA